MDSAEKNDLSIVFREVLGGVQFLVPPQMGRLGGVQFLIPPQMGRLGGVQ